MLQILSMSKAKTSDEGKAAAKPLGEELTARAVNAAVSGVEERLKQIAAVVRAKATALPPHVRVLTVSLEELGLTAVTVQAMWAAIKAWSAEQKLAASCRWWHGPLCNDKGLCSSDCRVDAVQWFW